MAASLVSGIASSFTLPNYHGSLFLLKSNNNAFSGVLGALTPGGGRVVNNYEFGINTEELPDPSQPAILEGADIVAAEEIAMVHQRNVTQIFNESMGLTYSKTASPDRIGINGSEDNIEHTANEPGAVADPFEHQAMLKLMVIRRKYNYSVINGVYQNAANPTATARKMRGVLVATDAGNVIDVAGAQITKDNVDLLLENMWNAGAFDDGGNTMIWVNAYNKTALTRLYGIAPFDRNIGGLNIRQLETDFGLFPIAMDRDIPVGTILVANMSVIHPVFNLVRDPRTGAVKGVIFREPVPTTKTEYRDHIYAEMGVDHGPGIYHGKIINTATAVA